VQTGRSAVDGFRCSDTPMRAQRTKDQSYVIPDASANRGGDPTHTGSPIPAPRVTGGGAPAPAPARGGPYGVAVGLGVAEPVNSVERSCGSVEFAIVVPLIAIVGVLMVERPGWTGVFSVIAVT
jgi:hypothetical protein